MTLNDYKQFRMQLLCDLQRKKECHDPMSVLIYEARNKTGLYNDKPQPETRGGKSGKPWLLDEQKLINKLESIYSLLCEYIRETEEHEKKWNILRHASSTDSQKNSSGQSSDG